MPLDGGFCSCKECESCAIQFDTVASPQRENTIAGKNNTVQSSKLKKNAPISHPQQVLNPPPAPGRLLSAPNRIVQVPPTVQLPFASPPFLNLPQVGINLQNAAFMTLEELCQSILLRIFPMKQAR
ncbi:unnamed protein product [Cylindrotheca closterium]|uniref:Uncharacterized protein n=1 Tax=Cylindrotheca closterium TaxID=2856 RepID=A0AAD2G4V9_9STRA|nr:unnamed protein product [Cylindrotheca closterium]